MQPPHNYGEQGVGNNALLVNVTRLDSEENFVNQALLGLFSLIIVVIRATV
jgi:hypothetical protein